MNTLKHFCFSATLAVLLVGICTFRMVAQPRIVAHRGYWQTEGSAPNSIAALQQAHRAGVWGSECDVHITRDGVVVIHHDASIDGRRIEQTDYRDLQHCRLQNGETLPTLTQYLQAAAELHNLQLVIEVKPHRLPHNESRCVKAVTEAVNAAGLTERVDYLAFSLHACNELLRHDANARVFYLEGDLPPTDARLRGMAGIDYPARRLLAHPEWIAQAHQLGMKVNAWTVNRKRKMRRLAALQVDYLTTDRPAEALLVVGQKPASNCPNLLHAVCE